DAFLELDARNIAELSPRQREIGSRMPGFPFAGRLILRLRSPSAGVTDGARKLIDRRALPAGDVVGAAKSCLRGWAGPQIGGHCIGDKGKVAALLSVSVNDRRLTSGIRLEEPGNDGGIGSVGVLSRAIDVEVPHADQLHLVAAAEDRRQLLVHYLRGRVGG